MKSWIVVLSLLAAAPAWAQIPCDENCRLDQQEIQLLTPHHALSDSQEQAKEATMAYLAHIEGTLPPGSTEAIAACHRFVDFDNPDFDPDQISGFIPCMRNILGNN